MPGVMTDSILVGPACCSMMLLRKPHATTRVLMTPKIKTKTAQFLARWSTWLCMVIGLCAFQPQEDSSLSGTNRELTNIGSAALSAPHSPTHITSDYVWIK